MTDYPYDMDLVVDPLNPDNVVVNAPISIFDPSDVNGVTLLALKDPSGLPLPNPVMSNSYGFIPPRIAPSPQTLWKSGEFSGYFNSYKGMRDESLAAADAASDSASAAAAAEAAALAAQAAAVTAAEAATGGGVAVDPVDADALIFTTKTDGSVIIDPADSDALIVTI